MNRQELIEKVKAHEHILSNGLKMKVELLMEERTERRTAQKKVLSAIVIGILLMVAKDVYLMLKLGGKLITP